MGTKDLEWQDTLVGYAFIIMFLPGMLSRKGECGALEDVVYVSMLLKRWNICLGHVLSFMMFGSIFLGT